MLSFSLIQLVSVTNSVGLVKNITCGVQIDPIELHKSDIDISFDQNRLLRTLCHGNRVELLKTILKHKNFKPEIATNDLWCIDIACNKDNSEILGILLGAGFALQAVHIKFAYDNNKTELLKTMIKAGFDPKFNDNALIKGAIVSGKLQIVTCLLDSGVPPDNSMLILAATHRRTTITNLLLKRGLDISCIVPIVCTNGHAPLFKIILDQGIDFTVNDNEAVYLAIKNGHYEIASWIIVSDPAVDPTVCDGLAILEAIQAGHYNVINMLLDMGVNLHPYKQQIIERLTGVVFKNEGHRKLINLLKPF